MKLKELIKEVELILKSRRTILCDSPIGYRIDNREFKLQGIKQTVEVFYNYCDMRFDTTDKSKDFQKLKKLLGVK